MTRAAGAASVNVDDLALGLYNAQGKAKSAGVSFAETVTTITALAPGFASSAEAGNSFKNFLSRVIPETDKAAQAMGELGLLTKDGTSAFYDAKGQFIGMEQAAGLLSKATKGLTQAEKSEALQRIFGNDAMGSAVRLAELGADGYRDLSDSIAKQNGVAAQAAQKQQGLNTAIDNLGGSLEALQITVFSKALPAITGLVNTLASGVNAITTYADATAEGKTALADIASIISTVALPALTGVTTALATYALVQTLQATPAILASLPAIAAQTTAWIANTAALGLAILPYVAIGAAIAVTVLKYQEFNEQITSATDAVLAQKQFWTDSAAAIADYGNQSKESAEKLKPLADNITNFRDLIHGELEDLGKREAAYAFMTDQYDRFGVASGVTADQLATLRAGLDADLVTINRHGEGLQVATKAYDDQKAAIAEQEQAILRSQAAAITATSVTDDLSAATAAMGAQATLTQDDIQKLVEQIAAIKDKGSEALSSYASTYSTFFADVEQRQAAHTAAIEKLEAEKNKATTEDQRKAIDEQIKQANQSYKDQETAAAASYTRQQEQQRQHLGQMLLEYIQAQATLATTDEGRRDRLQEAAAAIEKAYGLQQTSATSTFLAMTRAVDTFSKDSGQSIDTFIDTLHDQETAAKNTQMAEDRYYHDSAAAAATTFAEKGGDVQTYIDTLAGIPMNKATTIELPHIDDREREIRDINRDLAAIPKEVTVRIRVRDDRPEDIIPHSPTAFEAGLRGIQKALEAVGKSSMFLPEVAASLSGMTDEMDRLLNKSDAPDEANQLGENILEGMIEGIADNIGKAVDTGKDMINQVIAGMEDAADVNSPSGLTADVGANLGLGLVVGIGDILPEVAAALAQLTSVVLAGIGDMDEDAQQAAQDLVDAITSTMADLGKQAGDALVGAFGGLADILRQQAGDIADLAGLDPMVQSRYQAQIDQAQAEAGAIQDPEQAAAYFQLRSKQIFELAKLEQQVAADAAKHAKATDDEHAKNGAKLEQDRTALIDENAKNDRDANEDIFKLKQRLAAATNEVDRGYIQAEIAAREAAQLAERKRISDLLVLNEKAQAAEQSRYQQEIQDNQALADAEEARMNARIALIKRAQEAELKALAERRRQGGAMQQIVESIQAILDDLANLGVDSPVIIQQLAALMARLAAIPGYAAGGRYPVGAPFLVGEDGPEILKMDQPGSVIPMAEMRSAMAPALYGGNSSSYGATYNISVDARGSSLGEAAIERAVLRGVNAAGNRADLRIRTGAG